MRFSEAATGPWKPIGDIPQLKNFIPAPKNSPIRVQVQPIQDVHANIVEEEGTGNTGLWIALLGSSAALNLILLGLIFLKPAPKPLPPSKPLVSLSEYADYMADKSRLRQVGVSLAKKEELVEARDVRITPAPNRPPVPMPAAESGNVHGAWAYTQLFVEKRLKSPSTEKFRFGGYRDVTDLGGDRPRRPDSE